MNKKTKLQKGITLVSLITTVIVLCILAATAIGTISKDGIISKAQAAANKFNQALKDEESLLGGLGNLLDGSWGGGSTVAAPESVFLWKSNDPSSADYGVIIGYTSNIDNYPSLRFPDRCTKISVEFSEDIDEDTRREMRTYTENIKEIELPETVTEIGLEAFSNYSFSSLKKINIPNSVNVIGDYAFASCGELSTIMIPASVKSIGMGAFTNCSNVTSITIPNSVTYIGESAFGSCGSLTLITYTGTTDEWGKIEIGDYWSDYIPATEIICSNGTVSLCELKYELSWDGQYYYVYSNKVAEDVIIPSTYQELPVKEIMSSGFKWANTLTSIIIPNSITTIGDYAFESCSNLDLITFEGTVDEWNRIELGMDWDAGISAEKVVCSNGEVSLVSMKYELSADGTYYILSSGGRPPKNIVIPMVYNSLPVKEISDHVFHGNEQIESIELPISINKIGSGAFMFCYNLSTIKYKGTVEEWNKIELGADWDVDIAAEKVICSNGEVDLTSLRYEVSSDGTYYIVSSGNRAPKNVVIPSTYNNLPVKKIGDYGFCLKNNIQTMQIPNSITEIGEFAFYGSDSLNTITIPDSVKNMEKYAFYSCNNLTSITIGTGVETISENTFDSCGNLSSVILSTGIKTIEDYAFNRCTSLTSITIPSGTTLIGTYAFFECSSLNTVTIPSSVNSIGKAAFERCGSLRTIKFNGTTEQWNAINRGLNWNKDILYGEIVCSNGKIQFGYDVTDLFIWANVDQNDIGHGVLVGYTGNIENHTTLTIPERCTCISFESVTEDGLGDSQWFNESFRSYTQNIKEVELPNTVVEIGPLAFGGYIFSSLEKINIPSSVKVIESNAFDRCNSLSTITLPNSITTLGQSVFAYCESLTSINYSGTMAEWNQINKNENWANGSSITQIVCSDGTITL